jgi:ABC-type nitrate/sulfonate/bicarbonate transport system permease component
VSLEAIDWRARTSLRRADRALDALERLTTSVQTLSTTMQTWSTRWDKHWQTLSRLAWAVGVPVLVAVVLGVGVSVWRWISTLHH